MTSATKYLRFLWILLSGLAMATNGWSACVTTVDGSGVLTQTLYAGQTLDAGTVTVRVEASHLHVTYTTTDGWELTEAHLWVGQSLAAMPQAKNGNPKIGLFPHQSGDLTGMTTYSFSLALTDLGFSCPTSPTTTYLVAAHAALRKSDGSGGYQTETGWANGARIMKKGNWGTYFSADLSCECGSSGGMTKACETAFAFGQTELEDICVGGGTHDQNPGCATVTQNRWGWQIGPVSVGTTGSPALWAGAGQNDLSNAEHVGVVAYSYSQTESTCTVEVTFDTTQGTSMLSPAGWFLDATHLYVGYDMTQTVAPGQFGHLHEGLDGAMVDVYTISWDDPDGCDPVYLVAHAEACYYLDEGNSEGGTGEEGSSEGSGSEEPGGSGGEGGS